MRWKREIHGIEAILEGVEVTAQTTCLPSEDLERIKVALRNILDVEVKVDTVSEETHRLTARGRGFQALQKIYHGFRNRKALAAARKHLRSKVRNGRTTFLLNKQAAYVGVVSITEPGESDLGAIEVSISTPDIMELIMWMTKF